MFDAGVNCSFAAFRVDSGRRDRESVIYTRKAFELVGTIICLSGGAESRRVAIVVVEETAQTRSFLVIAYASSHTLLRMNDAAFQSLMITLGVIMFHILLDGEAKMLLPEGDYLVQTLALD